MFKNLNPKWDEHFSLAIEDINQSIKLKVYDYDRGLSDDAMGVAFITPRDLPLNEYCLSFLSLRVISSKPSIDVRGRPSEIPLNGDCEIKMEIPSKVIQHNRLRYFCRSTKR